MLDQDAWRWMLFACVLMVAPAMAVWHGWTYWRLVHGGVETFAVVTDKREERSHRARSYVADYRFADGRGYRRTGSQALPSHLYNNLRVGQRLDIVYFGDDPRVSVASLGVLHDRVARYTLASLLIALCVGFATWWWQYARRKTLEHDAEQGGGLPA